MQVLRRNLADVESVALITITAPGVDAGLPWEVSSCEHGPDERCSGSKGCIVHPAAAALWNDRAPKNRAKLHRAAAERVRRLYGPGPIICARATELQKRGVLHYHVAVDYTVGPQRARIDAYVGFLKELAPRYGFGFVDMKKPFDGNGGLRAASYCAKYIGKATAPVMEETRPVYVGQHLTSVTRITMRFCRMKRYAHYLLERRGLPLPPAEQTAMALIAGAAIGDLLEDVVLGAIGSLDELAEPPPSPALAA